MWTAVGVMLGVYALIAAELMHRTTATMVGAGILFVVQFLVSPFYEPLAIWTAHGEGHVAALLFEAIIHHVDWNVIFLLFGMMVIVAVAEETGLFQYMAYRAYEAARGRLVTLITFLIIITAVASALLDNVTTMLLMTPVTIELTLVLGINPISFLLPMVFASNVGGAATLIGDPPNILVGSYAGLSFNAFLVNLTIPVVLSMGVLFLVVFWQFRDEFAQEVPDVEDTLPELREEYEIEDWGPVYTSLGVLGGVVLLFGASSFLEMEVSIAALIGAAAIVPLADQSVGEIIHEVEWPTLVFFIMLFILVGAVQSTGALKLVANWVEATAGDNFPLLLVLVIWVSAISSAIVDNIPFTATMLPVVADLVESVNPGAGVPVGLWWALVLGADFGGNGTLVGASANVVTAGLAERAGHPIRFTPFMKKGIPVMIATCTVATGYVLVRYGGIL